MIALPKYARLVTKLLEKTASDSIAWRWDSGDYEVSTKIGGQKVAISSKENSNFEPIVEVKIYSQANYTIESFTDETLKGYKPSVDGFNDFFALMSALYERAYRQSIGADKALDAILTELDKPDDDDPF